MDILTAKTTLDCPLYACDFDPADASRLIVGGGGGSSRTGVGNRIALLDASSPDSPKVPTAAEVELAGDEDCLTCLAVGPRRGHTTIAYAGINSNYEALKSGNNQHFRVFGIDSGDSGAAEKGASAVKIAELARAGLFSSPTPDTRMYERVVRVSAPFPDGRGSTLPQLGACATGMAKDTPQIIVFDVTCAAAAAPVLPRVRGRLELPREAADLDIVQSGPDQYQLAYCTEQQLFLVDISTAPVDKSAPAGGAMIVPAAPYMAYDIPLDTASGQTARPVFRAIRYVTPRFILALCNMPRRTGTFLLVLRLPDIPSPAELAAAAAPTPTPAAGPASTTQKPAAAPTQKFPPTARITGSTHLPSRIVTLGTGLAVRNLAPPAAPGTRQGNDTQFVVAVGGACRGPAGNTLSLYTLEYQTAAGGSVELLAKLYPFRVLRNVHELPVTSIALSPVPAASSSSSPYLRLASVSVQASVVVHYIPLRKQQQQPPPSPPPPGAGTDDKQQQLVLPPRYVVAIKSRVPSSTLLLVSISLAVVVMALLAQSLLEIRAMTQPVLGARAYAPASWQAPLPARWQQQPSAEAYDDATFATQVVAEVVTEVIAETATTTTAAAAAAATGAAVGNPSAFEAFLASAVAQHDDAAGTVSEAEGLKTVLVLQKPPTETEADAASHTIAAVVHDEAVHGPARGWDELDPEQQQAWLQRLQEAGHWTEQMGEAVLRGVFFGELAGVVGAMVM